MLAPFCKITVAPTATVKAEPAGSALEPLRISVPLFTTVAPVYVFTPLSIKEPEPTFVRPKLPAIGPETVTEDARTSTVESAFRLTAPEPRLTASVPEKPTVPAHTCFTPAERGLPPVASSRTPLRMVKVPVPNAEETPTLTVPLAIVAPPE